MLTAGIRFRECPKKGRKLIQQWIKESKEFDALIARLNQMLKESLIDESAIFELMTNAELMQLNSKHSFNYCLRFLMPQYELHDVSISLINELMQCKYFKLKDIHVMIMEAKEADLAY
jgi:hypothetical protein